MAVASIAGATTECFTSQPPLKMPVVDGLLRGHDEKGKAGRQTLGTVHYLSVTPQFFTQLSPSTVPRRGLYSQPTKPLKPLSSIFLNR